MDFVDADWAVGTMWAQSLHSTLSVGARGAWIRQKLHTAYTVTMHAGSVRITADDKNCSQQIQFLGCGSKNGTGYQLDDRRGV